MAVPAIVVVAGGSALLGTQARPDQGLVVTVRHHLDEGRQYAHVDIPWLGCIMY